MFVLACVDLSRPVLFVSPLVALSLFGLFCIGLYWYVLTWLEVAFRLNREAAAR